jgi:hypothetical protein
MGADGAWAALRDVYPGAGEQRCWVHKIANVLDTLPTRLQARAKTRMHEMMEAPSERDARAARELFRAEFEAKYPKAIAKLDRPTGPQRKRPPSAAGGLTGRRPAGRPLARRPPADRASPEAPGTTTLSNSHRALR